MRRFITAALVALGAAACSSIAAPTIERLLVKPRAGVTLAQLDEILRAHSARRVDSIEKINVHIVVLSPQADAFDVMRKLRQNPHIEFVEIDEKLPPAEASGSS